MKCLVVHLVSPTRVRLVIDSIEKGRHSEGNRVCHGLSRDVGRLGYAFVFFGKSIHGRKSLGLDDLLALLKAKPIVAMLCEEAKAERMYIDGRFKYSKS